MHFLTLRSKMYLNGKGERSAERWTNSERKQYRGKYEGQSQSSRNCGVAL